MKKIVIFGAGILGKSLYNRLKRTTEVVVVDNDCTTWGDNVISPEKLKDIDFDLVYIAVNAAIDKINEQLKNDLGIPEYKIVRFYESNKDDTMNWLNRVLWLEPLATYFTIHGIDGSIAEVGVLHGDFSQHINRLFPSKRLYLFDTFEGYDSRDFETEKSKNEVSEVFFSGSKLPETSVDLVLSKIPYPDMAIIKKGYFPDTFNIVDEQFCFVFLDLNLYQPTKAGLELFYPLMSRGGVILVHDYFYGGQNGVSRAVDEFLTEKVLVAVPAGDSTAVAIVKN